MPNDRIISPFAVNPADTLTQEGQTQILINRIMKELKVCLPGIVQAFDGKTADIQPAVSLVAENGETLNPPLLKNVPVKFAGGGGFALYFPLQKGDTGWLIFADADISIFKSSRQVSPPNTYRRHDLADAVFIPDTMQTAQISEEDAQRTVLQTLDGQIKISLGQKNIKVKGNLNITGSLSVSGNINAQGSVTSGDTVTAQADVIGGGISLKNHVHGGVMSGSGTTGPAQ